MLLEKKKNHSQFENCGEYKKLQYTLFTNYSCTLTIGKKSEFSEFSTTSSANSYWPVFFWICLVSFSIHVGILSLDVLITVVLPNTDLIILYSFVV